MKDKAKTFLLRKKTNKKILALTNAISLFIFVSLIFPQNAFAKYNRIISLKPNITEILFSLEEGDKLIGATKYCVRPEKAKNIPRVADYTHANIEKILRLKPDLILASRENSSQKEIQFLIDQGLHVEILEFSTIAETLESINKMGDILKKPQETQKIIQQMQTDLKNLQKKAQAVSKKRVLFVVGSQPLVVAGGGTFFEEAANYLAVKNIAHQSRLKYPTYTLERLIRSQPDIIIEMTMGTENEKTTQAERLAWWSQFESIPAVKNHRVVFFNIEKMRAVPSLPKALEELFYLIH